VFVGGTGIGVLVAGTSVLVAGTGVLVAGTGVLVAGTGVLVVVRVAVDVIVLVAVMVFVTVAVSVFVAVAVAVSVLVAVAVSVNGTLVAVVSGAVVALGNTVATIAVAVLGRRVGGFVTTIDVALAALVGGITMSSTVGVAVCVADGVAVSVAVCVTRMGSAPLVPSDEFANCAFMRIINVTIKPSPSGMMIFSGIVSGRSPGRLGRPLRASSMLRRRGCVAPSFVTTGFACDCCVANVLSAWVDSMA
jgi:hypothetical protein